MQAKLAAATFSLPTNKDAPAARRHADQRQGPFGLDWEFVADNRADWVEALGPRHGDVAPHA